MDIPIKDCLHAPDIHYMVMIYDYDDLHDMEPIILYRYKCGYMPFEFESIYDKSWSEIKQFLP